jgi:hypothetical protein
MRVYFPTRNDSGVRDFSNSVTLSGYLYTDYRGPAEPAPKAAMTPVNLGAVISDRTSNVRVRYLGPPVANCPPNALCLPPGGPAPNAGTPVPAGYSTNAPFINSDGSQWIYSASQGRWINTGTPYNLSAPSVSSQSTPTPQVTVPPLPPQSGILVTSGGGTASPAPLATQPGITQSPATSTVNISPGSAPFADQVAAWLSGSTPIFSYNVPNALLAGGFAVVFAMLIGGGGARRR